MKVKSILSGVFAFAIASGTVLAFNEELRIPNGAYEQGGQCYAIDAAGCNTEESPQKCIENVNGAPTQLLENTGTEMNPVCGQELFRILE